MRRASIVFTGRQCFSDCLRVFHFWIAYPKVVREVTEMFLVDVDLEIFTIEFMKCVELALTPYLIS